MPADTVHGTRSRLLVTGCAIENVLVSFPLVCFTLALVTDIVYWRTGFLQWQNFSAWLLFFGLVVGVPAAVFRIVGFIIRPAFRARPYFWLYAMGNAFVLLLAIINSFVHAADGWTAVVPNGLILSAMTVFVMLATGALGVMRQADAHGARP